MPNKNLVITALVMIVVIVGGIVGFAVLKTDEHEIILQYVMVMTSAISLPVITALIGMLGEGHKKVRETHETVHKLANGEMDAKIERVVRGLLEEYKDPE